MRVLAKIEVEARDERLQIIEVRTRRPVMALLGDATGKLHDDLIPLDPLFLLQLADKIDQLALQCPSATTAAREHEVAIRPVRRVICKPAGPLAQSFFAEVTGAALHHDVALHNGHILLLFGVAHRELLSYATGGRVASSFLPSSSKGA